MTTWIEILDFLAVVPLLLWLREDTNFAALMYVQENPTPDSKDQLSVFAHKIADRLKNKGATPKQCVAKAVGCLALYVVLAAPSMVTLDRTNKMVFAFFSMVAIIVFCFGAFFAFEFLFYRNCMRRIDRLDEETTKHINNVTKLGGSLFYTLVISTAFMGGTCLSLPYIASKFENTPTTQGKPLGNVYS